MKPQGDVGAKELDRLSQSSDQAIFQVDNTELSHPNVEERHLVVRKHLFYMLSMLYCIMFKHAEVTFLTATFFTLVTAGSFDGGGGL